MTILSKEEREKTLRYVLKSFNWATKCWGPVREASLPTEIHVSTNGQGRHQAKHEEQFKNKPFVILDQKSKPTAQAQTLYVPLVI